MVIAPISALKELIYVRADNTTLSVPSDDTETTRSVITPETVYKALRNAPYNPVVCTVVNWITDQATVCPLVVMEVQEDGDVTVETRHDILDLLHKPSEFISGRELLALTIWDMMIYGQAFWHKERSRDGSVMSLTPLQARRVKVKGSRSELITGYEYYLKTYQNNGIINDYSSFEAPIKYKVDEIVHIRIEPDPSDPKNGLSPLQCVAKELLIDDQTEDFTSNVLINQGSPGGLLVPPDDVVLPEDLAKSTRDYVKGEFKGMKRGEVGVLRAAMRWLDTQLSPRNIELRSIQNTSEERICGVLGVHPVVVGLGAGNSQSRVGAATKEFERAAWENRIIPLQETIIEQIERQLMPDFVSAEDLEDWQLGWDRSDVMALQPDKLQEAQRWAISVSGGIAQRGEARRALDLDVDDVDDVYIMHQSSVLLPADATEMPALSGGQDEEEQEPTEEDEPTAPMETIEEEAEEASVRMKRLKRIYEIKTDLTDEQRRLLLSQNEDAAWLETMMADELNRAFDVLGEMAVDAFWRVNILSSLRALGRMKQEIDENEILRLIDMIDNAMLINDFVDHRLDPIYKTHALRTLSATVDGISQSIGVGVNLPDEVARGVVAQGGTRLGLLDVSGDTRKALFRAIHEGRSLGEGPAQLAARIRGQVPMGRYTDPGYRARMIARTETKFAQNVSTLRSYEAAETISRVRIIDAQGGHTDEACTALDGQVVSFRDAEQIGPLEHPNCTRSFSPVIERNTQPAPLPQEPLPSGLASSGFDSEDFWRYDPTPLTFKMERGYVDNLSNEALSAYCGAPDPAQFFDPSGPEFNYKFFNRKLREGKELTPHEQRILEGLSDVMSVALKNEKLAFRGVDLDDVAFQKGDLLDMPAPISATQSLTHARRFSEEKVLMEIHTREGKTRRVFTNADEAEVVYAPGQQMKVVDVFEDVELPAYQGMIESPIGEDSVGKQTIRQYLVVRIE